MKNFKVSFTLASKIFRNISTKVNDLHKKNYKILLKDIKEDLNKWKQIHVHGVETVLLRWQNSLN